MTFAKYEIAIPLYLNASLTTRISQMAVVNSMKFAVWDALSSYNAVLLKNGHVNINA